MSEFFGEKGFGGAGHKICRRARVARGVCFVHVGLNFDGSAYLVRLPKVRGRALLPQFLAGALAKVRRFPTHKLKTPSRTRIGFFGLIKLCYM